MVNGLETAFGGGEEHPDEKLVFPSEPLFEPEPQSRGQRLCVGSSRGYLTVTQGNHPDSHKARIMFGRLE